MTRIQKSIEVGVPIAVAYGQWTQFEEFPKFMEGIDSVGTGEIHGSAVTSS